MESAQAIRVHLMIRRFGVIFTMGSDMGDYYCVLSAPTKAEAAQRAFRAYPDRWFHLLPFDGRFVAHCRAYGKKEIAFGARTVIEEPNESIPPG